jgi:hypothetical protein
MPDLLDDVLSALDSLDEAPQPTGNNSRNPIPQRHFEGSSFKHAVNQGNGAGDPDLDDFGNNLSLSYVA